MFSSFPATTVLLLLHHYSYSNITVVYCSTVVVVVVHHLVVMELLVVKKISYGGLLSVWLICPILRTTGGSTPARYSTIQPSVCSY